MFIGPPAHCPHHDDLVIAVGKLTESVDSSVSRMKGVDKRLERIEHIIIGNGHEGLMTKVAKISLKVGVGATLGTIVATAVLAAVIRHLFIGG